MAARRPSLTEFVVAKESPALPLADAMPEPSVVALELVGSRRRRRREKGIAVDGRIGQTLRLQPEAWEALRVLAARERLSAHDLIVEGLNKVFRSRSLPEIA